MVTRTFAKLHFEDIDPSRFEDLCLSILYRKRRWEKIENLGRKGKDDAIDIAAEELLENGKRNKWHFQCKRYNNITTAHVRSILTDYCEKNTDKPDYYFLLTECDVTKSVRDTFEYEAEKAGFNVVGIWAASELEAILYSERQDLLFAFFGINLSEERNNMIGSIRRNIALKKRMHKDFTRPRLKEENCKNNIEEPWRGFINNKVLIRSIYDKSYPKNTLIDDPGTGYYKAEIYNWYHNGLMVHTHPFIVKANVRYLKVDADDESSDPNDYDMIEEHLQVIGCIPFENIIEYDIDGDEYYQYPHLFCDFVDGFDPYEELLYLSDDGMLIKQEQLVEIIKDI